jgi:hypothetical protein
MKTKFSSHYRFMFLATLTAVCACAPVLRAEWGSLRANNRRGRGPEIERGHPEVARAEERRRLDIEAERRHAFYWAGFRPGLAVRVLPVGYVQVSLGGVGFYYYDGVYFQPTTAGAYAVVSPPVGVIVPQVPDGADAIVVGPTTYYFAGGAFYLQQPTGFAVVPAPLGVTVTGLPPGATPVTLNGAIYYAAGSAYFRPVMQAGVTVYVTAHP